ncbi:MAG: hypothetical protein KC466_16615 [Myxococcales bacterium]|nr:hypothetical protein [Myxococcales bacterium]
MSKRPPRIPHGAPALVQALFVALGLALPFLVARKRPAPAEGPRSDGAAARG